MPVDAPPTPTSAQAFLIMFVGVLLVLGLIFALAKLRQGIDWLFSDSHATAAKDTARSAGRSLSAASRSAAQGVERRAERWAADVPERAREVRRRDEPAIEVHEQPQRVQQHVRLPDGTFAGSVSVESGSQVRRASGAANDLMLEDMIERAVSNDTAELNDAAKAPAREPDMPATVEELAGVLAALASYTGKGEGAKDKVLIRHFPGLRSKGEGYRRAARMFDVVRVAQERARDVQEQAIIDRMDERAGVNPEASAA